MWTPPVSPLPWFLFPFLALSRADAVAQGRQREPRAGPMAAAPPCSAGAPDGLRVPLCRICTARSHASKP
jgi:hypothetical protein